MSDEERTHTIVTICQSEATDESIRESVNAQIRAIRAEENEGCAQCCDPWIGFSDGSEFVQIQESAATQIAAAIRARRG